jgi:hypothetical protein
VNELDIWRGETNINGTTWVRQDEAEARIAELEAEVGRLKVCIICDHCSGVDDSRWCDEEKPWDESVWLYDLCHYTPSRWTARAEEGSEK